MAKIGIDLDDTILETTLMEKMKEHFFTEHIIPPKDWEMSNWGDVFKNYARKLFNDVEYMTSKKPVKGAIEAIKACVEAGNKVYIITSRTIDADETWVQVLEMFGSDWWSEKMIHFYQVNGSKSAKIKELGLDYFIDDRYETLEEIRDFCYPILISNDKTTWNHKQLDNDIEIHCYDNVVDALRGFKDWGKIMGNFYSLKFDNPKYKKYTTPSSNKTTDSSKDFVKFDSEKTQYDLIPPEILEQLAKVLTYGAKKYAPNNWTKGNASQFYSAMERHIQARRMGEVYDEDSGFLHSVNALAEMMFYCWVDGKEQGEW